MIMVSQIILQELQQQNENALGEVRTCQNLHFDKYVSPFDLKINRILY